MTEILYHVMLTSRLKWHVKYHLKILIVLTHFSFLTFIRLDLNLSPFFFYVIKFIALQFSRHLNLNFHNSILYHSVCLKHYLYCTKLNMFYWGRGTTLTKQNRNVHFWFKFFVHKNLLNKINFQYLYSLCFYCYICTSL